MTSVTLTLTKMEAEALIVAANAGTVDDAIDSLGMSAQEKAAFRRAYSKLASATYAPVDAAGD